MKHSNLRLIYYLKFTNKNEHENNSPFSLLADWCLAVDWNDLMNFPHHWLRASLSFYHHRTVLAFHHIYLQCNNIIVYYTVCIDQSISRDNNCWIRLSKILRFVSGEQINNLFTKAKG